MSFFSRLFSGRRASRPRPRRAAVLEGMPFEPRRLQSVACVSVLPAGPVMTVPATGVAIDPAASRAFSASVASVPVGPAGVAGGIDYVALALDDMADDPPDDPGDNPTPPTDPTQPSDPGPVSIPPLMGKVSW